MKYAISRWTNCAVSGFSNRFIHSGEYWSMPGRNDFAIHQRPGVRRVSAFEAGDERARDDLQIDEAAEDNGRQPRGWRCRGSCRVLLPLLADREREPERVSRDHRGQGQMRGESVLAYGDAVAANEAARHHEPAERSLRPAQNEQREDLRNEWLGNGPPQHEIGEWQQEHEADEAAQQPVRPFPPEDRLEAFEAEALVHRLILRDLLVFLEGVLPGGLAHRRQRAQDRLPFRDRQARAGKPRGPADHDHGQHKRCHGEKPDTDGWELRGRSAVAAQSGGCGIGE